MFAFQGYEGERNNDSNSEMMAQAKMGLDRNANKKKKKKMAVVEEAPSKDENDIFHCSNYYTQYTSRALSLPPPKKAQYIVLYINSTAT